MVGVLVSLHLVSGLSDSSVKASVVQVILSIAVMWRGVDESTSETPFFIQQKEKEKKEQQIPLQGSSFPHFMLVFLLKLCLLYGINVNYCDAAVFC